MFIISDFLIKNMLKERQKESLIIFGIWVTHIGIKINIPRE